MICGGKIDIHFLLVSPLLASVIGRAGPACGSGGQVVYLHAAEAEVLFVSSGAVPLWL